MLRVRVMPCLLLSKKGLVKTVQFKKPNYVGDPINIVRIFNKKEVDELIFLNIDTNKKNEEIPFTLIKNIASECFMPFTYGGGIRSVDDAKRLFALGTEKVAINTQFFECPDIPLQISKRFGSQSVVASIDVKKTLFRGKKVYIASKNKMTPFSAVDYAKHCVDHGAGEILLYSVDNDGVMSGYDLDMIQEVSHAVDVPVIACGGAGEISDFKKAVDAGASAVAAGSLVVYQGRNRSVLTKFPARKELEALLG